jgi:hypothetical protein
MLVVAAADDATHAQDDGDDDDAAAVAVIGAHGGTFYRASVPVKGVLIFYNKITSRRVRMAAHA